MYALTFYADWGLPSLVSSVLGGFAYIQREGQTNKKHTRQK